MDHREDLVEWSIDVVAISVDTQFHGRRLSDTAIIIGFDQSVFGVETDLVAVGSNSSSQSTAIITSPSNQHQPIILAPLVHKRARTQHAGGLFQF